MTEESKSRNSSGTPLTDALQRGVCDQTDIIASFGYDPYEPWRLQMELQNAYDHARDLEKKLAAAVSEQQRTPEQLADALREAGRWLREHGMSTTAGAVEGDAETILRVAALRAPRQFERPDSMKEKQ